MTSHAARLAALNDKLRQTFQGGTVVFTRGVQALPIMAQLTAIHRIKGFSDFTEANDPHGEHDYGS